MSTPGPQIAPQAPFVAIDFETANQSPDSACAVALVRVEGMRIVEKKSCLIRPPMRPFEFTHIHGISWSDVAKEATFAEAWPRLSPILEGASFLAAHNARFDRGVLQACCAAAGLPMPSQPFECTLQIARRVWSLRPAKLPDVCKHLGLPLRHHDAESDAEACARIVIASWQSPVGGSGSAPPRG